MNNIYKVIWSKAKNCYVVASEIAKSHTKSASGSEKMGGYGKRALLALAAASAIFCGGLVNVGAVDTVHVDESSTPAAAQEVYTKAAVDTALDKKADKDSVYTKADTYTKTEVNNAVDKKADKDSVYTKADTYTKTEVNAELAKKADASNVFTKDQTFTKDQVNLKLADYAKTTDVNTALAGKANAADVYTKTDVDGKLANKADKIYVDTEVGKKADKATTLTGYGITDAYTKTQVDAAVAGAVTTAGANVDTKLTEYAKTTYVDTEVGKKADKATTLAGYGITDAYTKGQVDTALGEKADKTALTQATDRITTNEATIAGLTTKTTKITYDAAKGTNVDGVTFNAGAVTGVTSINGTEIGAKESGEYIHQDNSIWGNMKKVDTQVKTNADDIKTNKNAITALDTKVGAVGTGTYLDSIKSVGENLGLLDAGLKKEVDDRTAADTALSDRIGTVTDDGEYIKKSATNNVSENLKVLDGELAKTNDRTGGITRNADDTKTTIEGKVTVDKDGNVGGVKDLTVDGKLNVGEISMKNDSLDPNGDQHHSATTITADGISNNAEVTDKNGVKTESKFTHDKEGSTTYAYQGDAANWKKSTSNVTADGVENVAEDSKGNNNTFTQTSTDTKNTLTDKEGNTSSTRQDSKGIYGYAKDKDGNKSYTKQEGNRIAESVIGQDGKQTKSEMTSTDITNTAKDGTITNTAQNVTNEGTESVTNKVGNNEVKVSQNGVDIKADADKTIKESVGAVTSRTMTDGNIIDQAGDMTVTTDKTTGTTFGNGTPKDTTVINGGTIGTNKVNANETNTKKLTAGAAADANGGRLTVDANDGVKGSYKYGDYTSRSYILANTLQSGVDNGKDITDNGFVGSRTDHYMDDDKAKLDETVKDADGSNVTKKTSTKTYTEIKDTNGNTNHVTNSATQSKQTLKDKDGNTLTTNQTATKNNFDLKSADGSKENHTTNTVDESRVAIKGENGKAELSTTDEGTTFKHSAAKEAFTEGGATNTTIKGNTITTGKVTMDYADVMKDLGVHGNATVDKDMTVKGNTTLGEAGKDTTLIVNSKATFNEKATFENGAEVKNGLTVSSGESTFNDKVTMKNGLDVTGGVASDSFTVKGTDIKIDSSGINAGGTVISNVADGSISEGSKDAVNGGQLYQVKNDLEGKVNKVGANAAAMANLHPMEFDPDSKWNIAAAMGNYGSETATAIGAFYRPNEDVMVNFSTAFGTGENMVGGGVSVRLGKGSNKLSREESNALKAQVNDLTARMDALLSVLNPNMSKDFPDVPENHWAYEAVSRLAGNDIVQGYPDGEFHGERTMTRYEMAEIIYNALSRGAEAEKELVEEFKPELQAMAASEKATAERAEG